MPSARRALPAAVSAAALAALLCLGTYASATPATASSAPSEPPTISVRVQGASTENLSAQASARVASMTLPEKAASVVMGHVATTDPTTFHDYMTRTAIGGFILMGGNIPAGETQLREQTAALTIDPALPPLIAIDQEGGDVSRLPWDDFPSSVTLKSMDAAAVQSAFAGRGALLLRSGVGVNFGIVADVTADPSMFIYRRALGITPETGAVNVTAAVTGEGEQAASTLKHFPGHGAAPGDSHVGIPSTAMAKDEWAQSDALPFSAGIEAGARLLMFGHLVYGAVDAAPASLSAAWHAIARDELGFTGVSITDDLGMLEASGIAAYADPVANAVSALAAGNDMVLTVMFSDADSASRIVDGIVAAVESGALPLARLDEASTRVTELRLDLAAQGRGLVRCDACAPAG